MRTGGLFFGPADNQDLVGIRGALTKHGVPFEELAGPWTARLLSPLVTLTRIESPCWEQGLSHVRRASQ